MKFQGNDFLKHLPPMHPHTLALDWSYFWDYMYCSSCFQQPVECDIWASVLAKRGQLIQIKCSTIWQSCLFMRTILLSRLTWSIKRDQVFSFKMLTYCVLKYPLKCAPAGTLEWISQHPVMIEPCLNCLTTIACG